LNFMRDLITVFIPRHNKKCKIWLSIQESIFSVAKARSP
jgi:hypothetical protein